MLAGAQIRRGQCTPENLNKTFSLGDPRSRTGANKNGHAESAAMIARLSTVTPLQVRVLMMLSGGLLNKQIAYEFGVSEAAVKAHVSAITAKARGREPYPGRHRRRPHRSRPMAAGTNTGGLSLS